MTAKALSRQEIIMNYSRPPSADDISVMALQILDALPHELAKSCEDLGLQVEEFPDETIESEMELETPYDLLALYRSGKEIAPGIEKKGPAGDDVLLLYRRPILDLWCETADDLMTLLREIMIEEIAGTHEFNETDIQDMLKRA